jgi:hypothetical protein
MLFRLFLATLAAHACLAAWVDTAGSPKPVVKPDGNLNLENPILAAWLNPEALVNMGDSQMLDGASFSWTPAKGSLATSDSHKNGPMVKRNQANGFPVVRFNSLEGSGGAAIKFQAISGPPTSATVFVVARLDLASSSAAGTYQHLWQMGATPATVKGIAVSKNGLVLVGTVGADPPAVSASSAASAGTINTGSWHIFAIDATSAHHKSFVDGTAAVPLANTATSFAEKVDALANYADGVFQIGNDETVLANGVFQGDIAEVRFDAR